MWKWQWLSPVQSPGTQLVGQVWPDTCPALSSTVLDCPPVSVHQLHSLANRFIRRQYNINNRKHLVYFYSNKGLVICYNSLYWILSWYKYYLSNSNIFIMRVPAAPSTIVIFSFDLLIELAERLTDWLTDSMTKHKDDTDRGWEEDLRPPSQCQWSHRGRCSDHLTVKVKSPVWSWRFLDKQS